MAILGSLSGINLNAVGDTPITLTNPGSGDYVVTNLVLRNLSAAPTGYNLKVGLFMQTGGVDEISAGLTANSGLTTPAKAAVGGIGAGFPQDVQTGASTTAYVRVIAANGGALTGDFVVLGESIS